ETMSDAIVGEHITPMLVPDVRPDVEPIDERLQLQSLLEGRRDDAEVQRFGLILAGAQQRVDVRHLQRVFYAARQAVRRFLTELLQDDRRRFVEIGDRPELK